MTAPIDTFFFLLDHPAVRHFNLLSDRKPYMTPRFVQEVYEDARKQRFPSREAAYQDWVDYGRMAGLEYAPQQNTLLKIVLKVKDEPELLQRWLDYHAAIVGLSNLVIMDCGSTDTEHWRILNRVREDVLILSFPGWYDRLHVVEEYPGLYYWLTRNCRYLTVMDADEFIFGFDGETISPLHVTQVLREAVEPIFAPTWITNAAWPTTSASGVDWDEPIRFALDQPSLTEGLISGKSVVRSSDLLDMGYIGHNLHVGRVMERMTPGSFGQLFQFHIPELGPRISRRRAAKHLAVRGVLPPGLTDETAIEDHLRAVKATNPERWHIWYYIDRYLNAGEPIPPRGPTFETRLLTGATEKSSAFNAQIGAFDFVRIWRETAPHVYVVPTRSSASP